jgi:hypothetical protein
MILSLGKRHLSIQPPRFSSPVMYIDKKHNKAKHVPKKKGERLIFKNEFGSGWPVVYPN